MADNLQDNQAFQLSKGLITDSGYNNQPESTWRYALNLVNETKNGDKGYVANELGNTQCINLGNYIPIGNIPITNNESILFLATNDGSNSKIAIQRDCILTTIVETECLNFNVNYPITGIFKIARGCNRVIYFRDSYNSDRTIDIDEILNNPTDNFYYDGTWHCELFKLSPDFTYPCLDYVQTNNAGGNLKLGTYQFAVALGDINLNFSGVLSVTQPIPIVSGTINGDVNLIEGGNPLQEAATTKSIELALSNLDTDFQYVKIYAIETISGVTTAYDVITLAIGGTTLSYTYNGVDYNSATVVDLNTINAPITVYDKSKTMEQQDQRMLRGNLQERDIDNSAWQRAANLVKVRYVTKPIKYNSQSSVFSGDYYVDNRTYMRDEVYALSISGVFTDGSTTSEYHIPGREANYGTIVNPITGTTELPTNQDPYGQNGNKQHNRKDPIDHWDTSIYTLARNATYPQVSGGVQDWNILFNPDTATFYQASSSQINEEDCHHLPSSAFDTWNNGFEGSEIQRWKVFNTAYIDEQNTIYDPYYSKGQLAYWESDFAYPSTEDCNGNQIFPSGNIRHHKMPDTTLEPHFYNDGSNDYIISLGLEFDLTAFKAFLQAQLGSEYNDIQGFKISRAKRDKGNKSVLDKGLSVRALEMLYDGSCGANPEQYLLQTNMFNKHAQIERFNSDWKESLLLLNAFPATYSNSTVLPDENIFNSGTCQTGTFRYSYQYMNLHNPKNKFYSDNSMSYIKNEKELWGNYEAWGGATSWATNQKSRASFRVVFDNYSTTPTTYRGTPMPYFTNRLVSDKINTFQNQNTTFTGRNVINATQQESLLANVDNFPDISNDGSSYGGGPPDSPGSTTLNYEYKTDVDQIPIVPAPYLYNYLAKSYYVALKNYVPTQYSQLHTITYYPINTCLISPSTDTEVLFGGDCFISQLSFRKTYTDEDFIDSDEKTWWQSYITYFAESEVNTKLRHENTTNTNQYEEWYYPYHGTTTSNIYDVIFQNDYDYLDTTSNGDVIDAYINGKYCYNKYNYNQDYSREQELKPNFPLSLGFSYCDTCLNYYPYRVIYSDKSYQEDLSDAYRRFPVNNYRDISAATGSIYNLFRQADQLYIRTQQSLWFVPTKQQELQTDQGNIQIGTGELFSIPPKELQSVNIGYNGGQTSLDLVINEYGAIYADAASGSVFMLKNGQQKEISNSGNRIWFKQNLPFNLLRFDNTFPFSDSPTSKTGIGLLGYYDPITRRYILTKKDYYPLYPDITAYVDNTNEWLVGTTPVSNPYTASQYFENKSWTISYSLEEGMWLSWHSYMPNFAWYTRNNFYTSIQGSNYAWVHNNQPYQTFYGEKYPHVFEFIQTKDPLQTKISNTLSYISNVQEYSPLMRQWLDIKNDTFNKGTFYNDSQSTGELDIAVKNNNDPFASVLGTFDPGMIYSERTESNWNISNIRDMVDQTTPEQPIFTSAWNSIKNSYYTDKVPNSAVMGYLTKSQFEMEPLRDNYMVARLSYKNALNDRRIITRYLSTNYNISMR